ncbi:hypothetical protein AXI76_gp178 [Pseudoalteromonas phage H101]|uniref:Uncharacterized protein n=1 Tax=Pseudoalteromonas phage H101 TaxID=1654919 RepID=A0A0H4INC4_9CAUD|nr:hypothetical protein AXI76_gp178 [Pseudoalteromonas phage H101]AKO61079.1 hypothetical protein [Pseudoalteromonas phage H101]
MTNRETDDPEIQELYRNLVEALNEAQQEYERLRDLLDELELERLHREFEEAKKNLEHHKHTMEWFDYTYVEGRV